MYKCKDDKCPSKATCYRFAMQLKLDEKYGGFFHYRGEKACGNFKEIPT